jgi:uncharacterized protein (TIGR03086 family)
MSDLAQTFADAVDFFAWRVAQVQNGKLKNPTPCPDWDVRGLLNHVVSEQVWVKPLIDGKTISEVGDVFDGDLLDDDPKGAWTKASADSVAAFFELGAMKKTVQLSYGDESGANYCMQMALDALIHGWDLSRGLGVDDTMPKDLVAWAISVVEPMQQDLTNSGMFGTPQPIAAGATDQNRLLAMLGRQG